MRPAVAARGLAQRFGREVALWPLDLELQVGDRLAVLGGNGAGKTTLLRLLATVARPAAGELALFGLPVETRRGALRPRIGYLAHQTGLYPALRSRENLELFSTLHGLPRARAAEMLEVVGLERRGERLAGELSRGEQQRLALARSLLHDPELWILDEPDAGLDSAGLALLPRLAEGRTVVLATHDRGLGEQLCSRTLFLHEGRPQAAVRLQVVDAGP
jgi:heme ABC exporter ATP-binding subunit CcmA